MRFYHLDYRNEKVKGNFGQHFYKNKNSTNESTINTGSIRNAVQEKKKKYLPPKSGFSQLGSVAVQQDASSSEKKVHP